MPIQYTSILEEYRAVREAAGLFDVSHMGNLMICGEGAEDDLRSLLTNDIKGIPEGRGIYAHMLDNEGLIIDDAMVFRILSKTYMLMPNAATVSRVEEWIMEHVQSEVINVTDRIVTLAIQGPRAASILQKLTEYDLSKLKRMRGAFITLQIGEDAQAFLPEIFQVDLPLAGIHSYVMRSGYTGEDGFEILIEADNSILVWNAILDAGHSYGLIPCGLGARDLLRLEMGFLLSGTDFNGEQSTLQTGPEWAIKWEHQFIGRDSLLKQRDKILTKLVGVELLEKAIPRHGNIIRVDGSNIGMITSGTMSPLLGKGIALAYVNEEFSMPGQELDVIIRDKSVQAKVVRLPFIGKR